MERRLKARYHTNADVYVARPGMGLQRCTGLNLSSDGVYVETSYACLPRDAIVDLIFVVTLGKVVKLHRRSAVVAHSTRAGAGLYIYKGAAKLGKQHRQPHL